MLFGYKTRRRLKRELRDAHQEAAYFKTEWSKEFDRYRLYKARVIELNAMVEELQRDQDR